jgi:Ca2+-binding RTX toxin-like protein
MVSISSFSSSTLKALASKSTHLSFNATAAKLNSSGLGKLVGGHKLSDAVRKPDSWSTTAETIKAEATAPKLSALGGFDKMMARVRHMISGSDFPAVNDGFFKGTRIPGTAGNDRIEVTYDASTGGAFVKRNGAISYLNAEQAKHLQIAGEAGNDTILVDPAFPYMVNIHGGAGDDVISGGARNDILNGGAGNDRIYGNRGHDTAYGGGGNDKIYLGPDQDYPVIR